MEADDQDENYQKVNSLTAIDSYDEYKEDEFDTEDQEELPEDYLDEMYNIFISDVKKDIDFYVQTNYLPICEKLSLKSIEKFLDTIEGVESIEDVEGVEI